MFAGTNAEILWRHFGLSGNITATGSSDDGGAAPGSNKLLKPEFLQQFKPRHMFKDMADMGRKRAETDAGDLPEVPKAG